MKSCVQRDIHYVMSSGSQEKKNLRNLVSMYTRQTISLFLSLSLLCVGVAMHSRSAPFFSYVMSIQLAAIRLPGGGSTLMFCVCYMYVQAGKFLPKGTDATEARKPMVPDPGPPSPSFPHLRLRISETYGPDSGQ